MCIAFDDPNTADLALNRLQGMQKEYLVELEDACVVVRDESGKVDYGISDDFIRQLGSTIQPNSSALFVLLRSVNADKVLPELSQLHGRVLRTSLSDADENRLREALSKVEEKAA